MGGIITGYYDIAERLFYLGVRMDFHADTDNNIQYVRISVSRPSPGRGKSEFIQDWQQYSLDSMFENMMVLSTSASFSIDTNPFSELAEFHSLYTCQLFHCAYFNPDKDYRL